MKNMLKSIPPEIGKLVKLKKLVLFQVYFFWPYVASSHCT
jgi:hypothetical protein